MNPVESIPDIARQLTIDPTSLTFLRYSQNYIYEFNDNAGIQRILRLTAASHRGREEIQSELDWLLYLYGKGLDVCPPLRHGDGGCIHALSGLGEAFHAVVFQKAQGRALEKADLSPRLYHLHGRHLGRLHSLSRQSPPGALGSRKGWDSERYFTSDIHAYLPETSRQPVLAHFHALQTRLKAVPINRENFGPCHLDLGYANFFLHNEGLTLFDFDNCSLGYFMADIAAALYGGLFTSLRSEFPGDRAPFDHPQSSRNLAQMWTPFREGYLAESPWPDVWNDTLKLWFQVLYLRAVVHAFRVQHPIYSPGIQAALDADIQNILTAQVPVHFDFNLGSE